MITEKIKQLFSSIFFFLCLLAVAPAVARADVEGVTPYRATPGDLRAGFFDGYGRNGYPRCG
jgi:hypothetical protein